MFFDKIKRVPRSQRIYVFIFVPIPIKKKQDCINEWFLSTYNFTTFLGSLNYLVIIMNSLLFNP